MSKQLNITIFVVLFCISGLVSQNDNQINNNNSYRVIKGSVLGQDTYEPYSNVSVEVSGGDFTKTNSSGDFQIKAKTGDNLIISRSDIETVHYVLRKGDTRIKLYVEDKLLDSVEEIVKTSKKLKISKRKISKEFKEMIDSAVYFQKSDANKSMDYVAKSMQYINQLNSSQIAKAYFTLGDIHLHWKQYDLAISNFKSSIQNEYNVSAVFKLAKSYLNSKDYDLAIKTYQDIDASIVTNMQRIILYEELGDCFFSKQNFDKSKSYYLKGLEVAKQFNIVSKVTDLNSKLGEVSFSQGNVKDANGYFFNSLSLAEDENSKRAAIEKERVANFYNQNQQYDQEISLRKKNLEELQSLSENVIKSDDIFQVDSITTQKTNYKIANAYIKQEKYEEAIPYLEQSISEANLKEDIIVEKDATKKLYEVFESVGDDLKAYETFQTYVNLVEKEYFQKEQKISQAAKLSRDLNIKQQRINSLEKDYEFYENKLLLEQQNKELIAKENRQQWIIIYSLIGGLVLISFLVFFMYRYIKQQQLNNNLLALRTLRSQMNPHFIFNALNSVNSFIATNDERTANRYLSDFSKLMRSVLENSEEDFIPLSKEIELLKLYTKLEHFRFQDKFDYSFNVDSSVAVDDYVIPPMLLQPYVENAVWHGLRYVEEKGDLFISIRQNDDVLKITIEDNGIGRERSKALKTVNQNKQVSKGMGNIEKRVSILNTMYQDKIGVSVEDLKHNSGTRVTVTLKKSTS